METLIDINQAVVSISKLPELVLPKGVCFETPGEKQIINQCKYFYRGLEAWLKHFVLHKALAPEVIFTDWKHFQGRAVLDSSQLTLITGLYSRLPLLQESCPGDDAPVKIWFRVMAINCEIVLTKSGILGKSSLTGKVDYQKNNLALLERYNEHTIRIHPPEENSDAPPTDEIDFEESPETYLDALASQLASQDEDFDKDYWQPYYSTKKRWTRKIRENKHLQAGCLLPSGELFLTGENKKIPPSVRSSVSKGFGCRQ
jgi:hypothetical protein